MSDFQKNQFRLLGDELLRHDPTLFFATVAQELRAAGLPPDEWFAGEGEYRLCYWKFERHAWLWSASSISHALPRADVEEFNLRHKGFDLRAPVLNRIAITQPSTFKACVALLRSIEERAAFVVSAV